LSWMNAKSSREQFFRLLDPAHGQRILDVGAGKGVVANRVMMVSGAELYAIDPDAKRIALVGQRYHEIKTRVAAAESIPFSDEFFDRVYTTMAVHHFADVETALRESERVLRNGGLLVIIDIDPRRARGRILQFMEKVMRHHTRFRDLREILEELSRVRNLRTIGSFRANYYYIIQCVKEPNPIS